MNKVKLCTLGTFRNGISFGKESYGPGLKIITVKDLFKGRYVSTTMLDELMPQALPSHYPNYLVEQGDLLFTRSSLTKTGAGMVAMVHQPAADTLFSGFIIRFRPHAQKCHPHYLLYLLRSPQYRKLLADSALQTNISNVNQDTLGNLSVTIPTMAQQEQIVSVLSALDDKIELNIRINTELEALAKICYHYWFGQYIFPDSLLPEDWHVQQLGAIAHTGSGGTPRSSQKTYYENGDIPWINSGELNHPYIATTTNYITEAGLDNSSARMFPENTLLVAMYGTTAGKTSLLRIPACTNQAVCAILPQDPRYTYYLKFALEAMYPYLTGLRSGSARENLSQDKIRALQITMPPLRDIRRFNAIVDPLVAQIVNHLRQNEELAKLRDWLLPIMMNDYIKK
ncbi:restriction endonuclease subunit S [Chitinophaga sp. HK235]|uniref:restriction endonuclease subunit S n=1 Tax=Chitinophaga sp. HK235 TaxID=2952571 RepID=UPI001BA89E42|nr:restriction endonuclease subunit S [Chitinophaga sp. HK235]